MENKDIFKFTISQAVDALPSVQKSYCYLNKFDAKIQASVLFLLSAEKDKKKPDKDFIERLKKELKTDLDYITDNSDMFKYLNKSIFVKNFYGEDGRFYKLSKV